MIDFMSGFADITHKVIESERLHIAEQRKWLHELRRLRCADKRRAVTGERMVIISQPEHLRGMHKVWF